MRKDIIEYLTTSGRVICDTVVYFNLHQTKQDWWLVKTIGMETAVVRNLPTNYLSFGYD